MPAEQLPTSAEKSPAAPRQRVVSLDALRGFAVLGILVMNIQNFAMIDAAYFIPTSYGDFTGLNRLVWVLSHLFADMKFMTIFSMLFGAGIVLMSQRLESAGQHPAGVHYLRMFWLLLFGLAHAHLLWHGDILVPYALCGFVVYLFRRLRPSILLILGLISIAVTSGIYGFFGWSIQFWPDEAIQNTMMTWQPTAEVVAEEVATMRGSWIQQLSHRVPTALLYETFVFLIFFAWRAGGLMLVGMALQKWGVFSARLSRKAYATMLILGLGLGLPLVGYGMVRNFTAGWSWDYSIFLGFQYNYWGSLLVSLGYVALLMLVAQATRWEGLIRRLSATGRMAFTNYLLQTLICTLIFYGHGLGLFGQVERSYQILIVFAVWGFLLWLSPVWLRRYRFGPMEWLWRTLTYMKTQPFRRAP